MRKWLIGCGVLFGIALVLCVGALVWAFIPPKIEIPPRQLPPNNAHPEYVALAEAMRVRLDNDARFKQIENAALGGQPLSPTDRAYYLQTITPFLKRYEQLVNRPCVVSTERSYNAMFPELVQMRRIARTEAYLMREELRQRRYRDAIRRADRLSRLADQVRNGGPLIHYLVGVSIHAIALDPLRTELPRIQERAALEALLQFARDHEQRRTPLWKCMQEEYYFGLSNYRDMAEGRIDYSEVVPDDSESGGESQRRNPLFTRFMVKTALPEYHRFMQRTVDELKLPFAERPRRTAESLEREVRHPLNAILLPVFARASDREAGEIAMMRLMGCVAAIRLHKLRTGKYPASLEALQLGEMINDPFSGKPFVYKTDPRFGFLIYSVSRNRVDDGGATTYIDVAEERGDMSPVKVPLPDHLKGTPPQEQPLVAPIWLR
ncbi:MAG: hypothetical protein WHS44_05725 [Fimbriimonadales bacterium]|nr:MAG: hypothetical protein KatS3mg018_2433 [Fimbriimonadales bacterium]